MAAKRKKYDRLSIDGRLAVNEANARRATAKKKKAFPVLGKAKAPKRTSASTAGTRRSLLRPNKVKGNRKVQAAIRAAGGGGFLIAPQGVKGSVGAGSDS